MASRRFSHAIAEGDGISVIAAVEDAESARAAEAQRAEALVVRRDPAALREATSLPILWRASVSPAEAAEVADAIVVPLDGLDAAVHAAATDAGLDCAVEVRDEEEIEQALEAVDPEIFVLSPAETPEGLTPLEHVLDLLAAVPAGKLAIADLDVNEDEVEQLERAGVDGVIVGTHDVAALTGAPPPEV